MKKGIASILLVLYMAFSTGVIINMHFCMNRFDSVKLGAAKTEICGKCGMHTDAKNGCCHDDIKIIKIGDSHQASSPEFQFSGIAVYSPLYSYDIVPAAVEPAKPAQVIDDSPPLHGQDILLRNCVFRI